MSIYEYEHKQMYLLIYKVIKRYEMDIVQILKALGDENRIRILNLLKDGELCVCEIEHILGVTQSNASRHLTKLNILGIVIYERKAQWVYYKLNKETLEQFPFIKELLDNELNKIDICKQDTENLIKYKKSGMTCENLRVYKKHSENN